MATIDGKGKTHLTGDPDSRTSPNGNAGYDTRNRGEYLPREQGGNESATNR